MGRSPREGGIQPASGPPIVGIGASAGGIKALQTFFAALPPEPDATFVVIVHLDPEYRSELAGILANNTKMPVTQVVGTQSLSQNHVYVIAPNFRLRIADHMITALPFDEPRAQRAPIDLFFRSLAEAHDDGFAIVLSGAGADGTVGVKAIKEAGGIVLVQDPNEAEYGSMPRNAIATGIVDFVLPVQELAHRLVELLRASAEVPIDNVQDTDEETLRRIVAHLRVRVGHDFSQYKRTTVLRRIARRAQVNRCHSLLEYYAFLRDNAAEAQALFSDLLISVTTFFRDPAAFDQLARKVIPNLFEELNEAASIRVWVPGCATGEETYSIGILLLEEAVRRDIRPEIQVFGSDLDSGALAIAREGKYPTTIEGDVSDDRLRRFFVREGDHYQVRRELREIVLFASHSLLRDPPFSRVNLISCRNLLIYLDRPLQEQVCATFHYALCNGGYLFLGPSESADRPVGLFSTVDREARIYRANAFVENRPALPMLIGPRQPLVRVRDAAAASPVAAANDLALHRNLLERFAPPSMVVDSSHQIIHLSDNAGRYLQPSGGPVSADANDMVRPELRFDLRTALNRAFDSGETTLSPPLLVQFNGSPHRVHVQVRPEQPEGASRRALVLFIEGEAVEQQAGESPMPDSGPEAGGETIRKLRDDLQIAQNRLRTTREAAEGTTEDLRAANEELQSINEEYRSTAEELETSKEELQSVNEELLTVNNELKHKLDSVSRAHSDLQNLMSEVDFGTLFLDTSLRIKRFTPRVTELFNVTLSDEGRPITDFTHQLVYKNLAEHARAVLRDLAAQEQEVQADNGNWYLVKIRPYRTVEDKVDGVVITFVDTTARRKAERALHVTEDRLKQESRLVELSRSPIFVWDFDDGILQWNRGSEALYGYSGDEVIGKTKEIVLQTIVPGSSFAALRQTLLAQGTWSGELIHHTKDGRSLTVESHIELVAMDGRRLVLESTRDITEQKRWEERGMLMIRELGHRVSNTLAVVQSMAHQMLLTTPPAEFAEIFEGRLTALANSHRLMIEGQWQGADLREIAVSQLSAHMSDDPPRLRMAGVPVHLSADVATPLALIFHELATNAVKYGALSKLGGQVDLRWTLSGRKLRIIWQETGGPAVTAPAQQGLGGLLIEQGLPGASVTRDFASSGLVCTIDLELPEEGDDAG